MYVIMEGCVDILDQTCVQNCPVDCIYEGDRASYINPAECIDCGACEPVCPVDAIAYVDQVPSNQQQHIDDNRVFFQTVLAGRSQPLSAPGGAGGVGRVGVDTPLIAALPRRESASS
ncbi:MAG: 4Fe-4S ferredoxin, iron-sulfur binding protein [Modestobacter sp.]|jgi:NAD-dependent dihydropyrimidine dehydrogenase PreA subunit|nr:4Fe-4S ferredoxin, iron-sulfur binding protein [Modestobacter sp.]